MAALAGVIVYFDYISFVIVNSLSVIRISFFPNKIVGI
jgi:hypothetical protein